MSAHSGLRSELRHLLRARRTIKAKLEDVQDQRAELMAYPKVARYVKLHADEQALKDEQTRVEARIVELADLQEELL